MIAPSAAAAAAALGLDSAVLVENGLDEPARAGRRDGGGDVIDDSDRRLETLLDRIEQLRRELEVIGRRLDGLEGLNRIAEELHELNGSLQTLAYAALGRRGPDVRENR